MRGKYRYHKYGNEKEIEIHNYNTQEVSIITYKELELQISISDSCNMEFSDCSSDRMKMPNHTFMLCYIFMSFPSEEKEKY